MYFDRRVLFALLTPVAAAAALGVATPVIADDNWPHSAFRRSAPPPATTVQPRRRASPEQRPQPTARIEAPVAPRAVSAATGDPAVTGEVAGRAQPASGQTPAATQTHVTALPPTHIPDTQTVEPRVAPEVTVANPWQWRLRYTSWTTAHEKRFEEFVQQIGESGCRTTDQCLSRASSNPAYAASNPAGMFFYADCADLPYMLRAYFAWKNGLPFSYASAMRPLGSSRDIRYSAGGNVVSTRRDLVEAPLDARKVLPRIMELSSAVFRTPPSSTGALLPDHYPVEITRTSIRPGTVIYDPNGHVAVVYKVSPHGRIHYIDAHPDNSITRGVYSRKFARSSPAMGAGFKRWRPLTLVGATRLADGSLTGGRITHHPDEKIADWSAEQFFGTEADKPRRWQDGRFLLAGEPIEYYDFVRLRLAARNFRYDPVEETRTLVEGLCEDIKYRVDAIDVAIAAGIHRRPQPARLPRNIYGTEGDWETYSTPSRDARLKTAFNELRDEIARFLKLADERSERIVYTGKDLRGDIRHAYLTASNACRIQYTRSDGTPQALGFEDVRQRLFALSFDPYHCPELRWGASGDEARTCPDGAVKRAWYDAEQRLRNQIERTYEIRMDHTLDGLRQRLAGSGVDTPPDVDALALVGGPVSMAAPAETPPTRAE